VALWLAFEAKARPRVVHAIMPSVATRRSDTKVLSSLKRNTPGRWPGRLPVVSGSRRPGKQSRAARCGRARGGPPRTQIRKKEAPAPRQNFPSIKDGRIPSEGFCELVRAAEKVGYRRRVPARTSRGPNATAIERPRDRFERGRAVLRIASMTGRRPDANWSAATIWICRPHTPAAAMFEGLPSLAPLAFLAANAARAKAGRAWTPGRRILAERAAANVAATWGRRSSASAPLPVSASANSPMIVIPSKCPTSPPPAIQYSRGFRARSFPIQAERILGTDVCVEAAACKVIGTN
jgi:hypothetical protein